MMDRPLALSFSTLGCGDLGLQDVLDLAAQFGIGRVELRALGGGVDLPGYFERHYGQPVVLAQAVAASGIKVVALGTSFRAIAGHAVTREHLLAHVPWAEAIGCPWLRIFDGGHTGSDAELASVGPMLQWWEGERKVHGWTTQIMVETHDALVHPEALQRFLTLYPDVAILWDSHHTWRLGGEAPADTYGRVRGRCPHIHVKDSVTAPFEKTGHRYTLPGEGEFPFSNLARTLLDDGYGGTVSLEWERHWHPDLPPLDLALPGFAHAFAQPCPIPEAQDAEPSRA